MINRVGNEAPGSEKIALFSKRLINMLYHESDVQETLLDPLVFVFAELLVGIQQAANPDVLLVNLYAQ